MTLASGCAAPGGPGAAPASPGNVTTLPSWTAPRFEAYPVTVAAPASRASSVDTAGMPDAGKYADKLASALKGAPNFAGSAVFVEISRGDAVHHGAVVDLATGKAVWAPDAPLGYESRAESRLLIANPPAAVDAFVTSNGCNASQTPSRIERYLEWKDGALREVASNDPCEAQLAQEELTEFESRFPNFDATGGVPSSSYARILANAAASWKMGNCKCTAEPVDSGSGWRCSICCGKACGESNGKDTPLSFVVDKSDGSVTWTGTSTPKNTDWLTGKPLTAHAVLSWQHTNLQNRARALGGH